MQTNNTYLFKKAIWMASAVVFLSIPTFPAGAQNMERPTLTAAQCQPLSADNADLCCVALNRQQLLTDDEINQCPPLTTARIRAAVEELDRDHNSGPTASDGEDNGGGGTPTPNPTDGGGGGQDNGGGGQDNGGGGQDNGRGGQDNGGGGQDNGGGGHDTGAGGSEI